MHHNQMEELKAALSSTEYEIITECALANFSETPNTLPPLIGDYTSPSAVMTEPLALQSPDTANTKTEDGIRWITTKVSVSINLVELCLYYGLKRDASLATLQVVIFSYKCSLSCFLAFLFCFVCVCLCQKNIIFSSFMSQVMDFAYKDYILVFYILNTRQLKCCHI